MASDVFWPAELEPGVKTIQRPYMLGKLGMGGVAGYAHQAKKQGLPVAG